MPTAKPLLEHINESFKNTVPSIDTSWIATYSSNEWGDAKWSDVEENMSKGRTILIQDTNVCKGWNFDVPSGRLMKPGRELVEVQGERCLEHIRRAMC